MKKYDNLLNPQAVKNNLVFSSLYLSAYELLKSSIIERIESFFATDYNKEGKPILTSQYKKEVLGLHKYKLAASSLWLEKMEVITEDDVRKIDEIRKHRNKIAHDLPNVLVEGFEPHLDYFMEIRRLLEKIEIWWIQNFEIPINSDYDGIEIKDEDIRPGPVIILDHLISIVFSDFEEKRKL